VGAAGRVLYDFLASVGLDRGDVYITEVVKDGPPGNRNPRAEEIDVYAPFLLRQIAITRPDVVVTLGRCAMSFILEQYGLPQQGQKIGDLQGEVLEAETSCGEVTVVPLYHPAAALYNQDFDDTIEEDFQILKQFV
jgi:DNA polymerase